MSPIKFLLISVFIFSKALGQGMVFTEPIKLNSCINTDSEEVYPLMSPDSTGLYFVRAFYKGNIGGRHAGQDIWYVEREKNGEWGLPVNLAQFNSATNNVVVGIAHNDSTLYLLNTYSNPLRWDYGIAFSVFENSKWGKPREFNLKFNNSGPLRGYYVTPSEDVILMSSESGDSYGKEDLYLYFKEGEKWIGPIHFDESINTPEVEMSPFLSADHKTLFFSSNGHGGFGDFDIFMSNRLDDTWMNWSAPVNLGATINTSAFEAYMSTYPGGETFFVSSKDGNSTDIYSTTFRIQEEPAKDTAELVAREESPLAIPDEKTAMEQNETGSYAVVYTVQILALSKLEKPDPSYFNNLGSAAVNKIEGRDGWVRFYVGEFATLSDAVETMNSFKTLGYYDAFVRNKKIYSDL